MKNKKNIAILILAFLIINAEKSFSEIKNNSNYHFIYSKQGETERENIEGGKYNSIVISAFGGENIVNIKNTTIESNTEREEVRSDDQEIYINPTSNSEAGRATSASLAFADLSNEEKNNITLENININNNVYENSILSNDQSNVDSKEGSAHTTINIKGVNNIYTSGTKGSYDEYNGIAIWKNTDVTSEAYINSDKDSTLNITVKSGKNKSRGISSTQYKEIYTASSNETDAHKVIMNFYGDVNIKIDRAGQNNAENYGLAFVTQPVLARSESAKLYDATNTITFHKNVNIDVTPYYETDKNGKIFPKTIGDAINVDGKGVKVDIKGKDDSGKLYDVKIKGDIHVLNGAVVKLNLLTKDSYLEGETHISKLSYTEKGNEYNDKIGKKLFRQNRDNKEEDKNSTRIDLTMDNGSNWYVKGFSESKLNTLEISNGAKINFSDEKNDVRVSVLELKGDEGIFKMQGNIITGKGDLLEIRKGSKGNHYIEYDDHAEAKTYGNEYIKLVLNKADKENNKAIYRLTNTYSEQGAYLFRLGKASDSKVADIKNDEKGDFYLQPTGDLSPGAQGALILSDVIYQLNSVYMDTLVQRLGEVHFDKNRVKAKNVWFKNIDGLYKTIDSSKTGRYENHYYGFKVGVDWLKLRENWINYNGLEFGNINSNTKILDHSGKANVMGMVLGLYSTWINKENNVYFDFVARAAKYTGKYNIINYSNINVSSNRANTTSYMLTSEIGKRIYLDKTNSKEIYIQPETQLSYHSTEGYPLHMSNGLNIKTEDLKSLVGRIGFRVGMNYLENNKINPYIKAMYKKEFLGTTKHHFNDAGMEESTYKDKWFTYGLGISTQNQEKGRQIYLEFQKSLNHRVRQNWQIDLGIRYTF
ncbi:autotransporter outer membrane beta-barrel domain-containing protein [Fusobacterium massiliense]|uniref:autotransporter outer membrane beta-barrel domain-containing protein n=1 Tax=Fusobacterium massiliense TaxID=1852365 RepID=UPI0028EFB2E4|nr:autotransporter outer membrane beta-barrel domain-containing protein [Fusobacterium massiliense]